MKEAREERRKNLQIINEERDTKGKTKRRPKKRFNDKTKSCLF